MNEVLHGVGGVSQLIGQIALASGEQSKWIAQVTLAVVELDRVTQQNATLVQAVSATAGSLSGQAAALRGAITRFTLPAADDNVMTVATGQQRQISPPYDPVNRRWLGGFRSSVTPVRDGRLLSRHALAAGVRACLTHGGSGDPGSCAATSSAKLSAIITGGLHN
ncbi:hypothetical protein LD112_24810 [Pantoea agglomerans]|nr:hypothetical protein [Pantoea agglomerans]